MIKQIVISENEYKDFELLDLTKNTIILFNRPWVKNKVASKIAEIWEKDEDEDDSIIYGTDLLDESKPEIDLNNDNVKYLPTTVINLKGGQRFIFTVEAPFILQATHQNDIWFVDTIGEPGDEKIICWALTDFIGHKEDWEQGAWNVYKNYCGGVYGCYRGY